MTTKICPVCHSPVPAHAPGGLCPACLLRDAEDFPESGRAVPSIEEVAAAFPTLEVLDKIGQGGMGVVFKVRQPALDRIVALKILLPELGRDPAFAERFAREARVLGKLNHPNIVMVFEHGERGGFFYLLMEYVDGVNLRQAMRAGRFTPEQALAIVPGICDALQAAHSQGIWHRDIKPENILLDAAGGVKIADFGIARIVGDPQRDFTLTHTGNALGSAAYMAPEQHEKPHDVDHRADIYSLGVVIYEMLTGELPLGRFPAPSQRAQVNARIDEIVLRTLEKERDLRHQSATEVKTDVQGAATAGSCQKTSSPEGTTAPDRLSSPVRWSLGLLLGGAVVMGAAQLVAESSRSPQTTSTMAVLTALGVAAAACGLLGSLWSLRQMKRGRMPATGRHLLLSLVCWPIVLGLTLFAATSWFKIFKRGDLSSEATEALFGYALVAIATPVIAARLIWLMFGTDPAMPSSRRRDRVRSGIACMLAAGAIVTVKFVVEREAAYRSYRAQFIQIAGEISQPEKEDLTTVRAAVEQALGENRSGFRHAIYGSRDLSPRWKQSKPATPYVMLEATSPDSETFRKRTAEVAQRLRALLPKRIEVNAGAGGISSGGDLYAPKTLQDGYNHTRSLNVILLLVPLAVVLLVATTTQAWPWLPVILALISAAACERSSWPSAPAGLPPSIASVQPLPPLAAPEYDFSTTRSAIESLIKAAQQKDVEGFQSGISGKWFQLSQVPDPSEALKLFANWSYSHQVSRDGDRARVRIKSANPADQQVNWPMIRENGGWKLENPLGGLMSAAGGTVVIEIAADQTMTVDGEACPPETLGERIAVLAKRRPEKVIIRAAKTTSYQRVTALLEECQKAGLSNVSFSSTTTNEPVEPTSPGKAMESIIKAARERNGTAFAGGLSRALNEKLQAEGSDPLKNFGDFNSIRLVEATSLDGSNADVVVEATDGTRRRFTFRMILEDGAWKLNDIGH